MKFELGFKLKAYTFKLLIWSTLNVGTKI